MKRAADERGVVLVIVLLVLTLLTIATVEFAYSTLIYSHLARNSVNGLQATLLARSGLNFGEGALTLDTEPLVDSFLEDWCPEPGPFWCRIDESLLSLPPNMRLRIQIFDEGGKMNINFTRPELREWDQARQNPNSTLVPRHAVWQAALRILIEAAGGDPEAAERMAEYWDNLIETQFGADSGAGGAGPTPGATPNPGSGGQSLRNNQAAQLRQYNFPSLDDANDILGLDPVVLQRLRRYATATAVFSTDARKLNANTAPREVLQAVLDDPGVVDSIVFQRESVPLQQADVTSLLSGMDTQDPRAAAAKGMIGFKSEYFRIYASAVINPDPITGEGGLARSASVLVRRSSQAATKGNNGAVRWTLTRLDWQKEGGAVLFNEESEATGQEPGASDADRTAF